MSDYIDKLLSDLDIDYDELKLKLYEMSSKDFTDSINVITTCTARLVKCGKCCNSDELYEFINIQYKVINFLRLIEKSKKSLPLVTWLALLL
jgi:hypothetical protein